MSRRNKDAKIAELEAKLAAAEADAALDDANADARIAELEAKLSHMETEKLQIAVHDELMTKKLAALQTSIEKSAGSAPGGSPMAESVWRAAYNKRCGEVMHLMARIAELEAALEAKEHSYQMLYKEAEGYEAEIKRLKAILKPLVAPTFKLDVPIEEAIEKGIPSRDDGRDSGE